ncbi:MAG: hypothetical protein AAGF13_02210 [Pseudomonadota bacterium]
MRDHSEMSWLSAETPAGRVCLDPALGNIRRLSFQHGERVIEPLHAAPWINEPETDRLPDLIPVERQLSGDFFCAPFGASDVFAAPAHGWTANSEWVPQETAQDTLQLTLKRQIQGATFTKTLRIAPDAPLLYQEHLIAGGEGLLTVAHHPMVNVESGARFSTSPKRAVLAATTALEEGRNALLAGARSATLDLAGVNGPVDLTQLPIAQAHEDFVTLIEAKSSPLGWSAILRPMQDDVVFILKDPRKLPVTMLWHSNGGRDYAPWNGRHTGILGIEDGCAAGEAGHRASLSDNPVAREGVPTALTLAPTTVHRIAHVIGAVPRPKGWQTVADITLENDHLMLTGDTHTTLTLPFVAGFFSEKR